MEVFLLVLIVVVAYLGGAAGVILETTSVVTTLDTIFLGANDPVFLEGNRCTRDRGLG